MSKQLQDKIRELQLRRLSSSQSMLQRGNDYVPAKKKSKPVGYKMQNTFNSNLSGLPGGSRVQAVSQLRMIEAAVTGCRTRKDEIGALRSARNSNTTQGSYIRTVVREDEVVVSDRQGRKVFGR
jgi:hypothetical protein